MYTNGMATKFQIPDALLRLRAAFQSDPERFDIRFVGGCVRDWESGTSVKDIDLCTDADPEQQIAIYQRHAIPYHETGLKHGTITVVPEPGQVYEITSLRGETDHDGRHATVYYHRDWRADQARRDLTINSMMMDFEGTIYDPFGGLNDLTLKVVRFVGEADQRLREDYLRILRWVRFQGRYGHDALDPDTVNAVRRQAEGLAGISRERVWSEVSRIISGPRAHTMLRLMINLGLCKPCGLPQGSFNEVERLRNMTLNPVTLMVGFLVDPDVVAKLAQDWRWSRSESDLAAFLTKHYASTETSYTTMVAGDGWSLEWVIELACLHESYRSVDFLRTWTPPVFPVKGADLLQAGLKPGPSVGQTLSALRTIWCDSGFVLRKEDLIARLPSGS